MEIAYQAWSETFGLGLLHKETNSSFSDVNKDSADTETSGTDSVSKSMQSLCWIQSSFDLSVIGLTTNIR